MEKETYEQKMNCENCGHSYVRNFKKGQDSKGFYTCENCGCLDARSAGKPKRIEDNYKM